MVSRTAWARAWLTWAHMGPTWAPHGPIWVYTGPYHGPYGSTWALMGPYGPVWALVGPARFHAVRETILEISSFFCFNDPFTKPPCVNLPPGSIRPFETSKGRDWGCHGSPRQKCSEAEYFDKTMKPLHISACEHCFLLTQILDLGLKGLRKSFLGTLSRHVSCLNRTKNAIERVQTLPTRSHKKGTSIGKV